MYEHLTQKASIIDETRILIQEIACNEAKKEFISKGGYKVSSFYINALHPNCHTLIKNLKHLYHDCGMGFKLICSLLGNITYTRLRTVFRTLGIQTRSGKSCVTEGLKKIRSENAKKSTNPWKDWPGKDRARDKKDTHHLGGWHFNTCKNKYVWLRSSWEYGYAQWLDANSIEWDVEVRSYLLSDGRYYRPDFFIYVNNCLDHIVEIKSLWVNGALNRIDKFETFRKEYPSIKCALVTQELFDIIGRHQLEVLAEWKTKRLLEIPND